VEKMISIRCSEYEQLLSQQEELGELLTVDILGFHKKEQAFINRLQKLRQSIFTFLIYPNVTADNNASKRTIRNVKTKGQFRNDEGQDTLQKIIDMQ
jgi:hypothetical protein